MSEVVHRHGDVGQVGVPALLGQLAAQVRGFLGGGQDFVAAAMPGQIDREVVALCGEVGQVGVGVVRG